MILLTTIDIKTDKNVILILLIKIKNTNRFVTNSTDINIFFGNTGWPENR